MLSSATHGKITKISDHLESVTMIWFYVTQHLRIIFLNIFINWHFELRLHHSIENDIKTLKYFLESQQLLSIYEILATKSSKTLECVRKLSKSSKFGSKIAKNIVQVNLWCKNNNVTIITLWKYYYMIIFRRSAIKYVCII